MIIIHPHLGVGSKQIIRKSSSPAARYERSGRTCVRNCSGTRNVVLVL